MVIIGKTGSGKSSTANTILDKKTFKSEPGGKGVTKESAMGQAERFGKRILLVDTPGLFDPEDTNESMKEEIGKCIAMTAPGFHAFLLVVQVGRFTPEELNTVKEFEKIFGEKLFDYTILVFTRFDELLDAGMTLEFYLENKIPDTLKTIIERSGSRYIGFNNKGDKSQKEKTVKELLHMIENMDNDGDFYTNELYAEAEKYICKQIGEKIAVEAEKKAEALESFYQKQMQDEMEKMRRELEREKAKQEQQHAEELKQITELFQSTQINKHAEEERIRKAQAEAEENKRRLEEEKKEREKAVQKQREAEAEKEMLKWQKQREIELREEERKRVENKGFAETVLSWATSAASKVLGWWRG